MTTWTTPTIPVHVRHADLTSLEFRVCVTIAQGDVSVTVNDPPMVYDSNTDTTTLFAGLSQQQCGMFHHGPAKIQVNAVDWSGFRIATNQATKLLGSNLLKGVLHA